MEYQVILDSCAYHMQQNGTCVLTGWMYTGAETAEFQIRADRTEVPFEVKAVARPDVQKAYSKTAFPDVSRIGFEITIHGIEDLFESGKTLRIRAVNSEISLPVFQKTAGELREEYLRDTVRYYIEKVELRRGMVYVQGWCIYSMGELTMRAEDEKLGIYGEAEWTILRRADLAELFRMDLSHCTGFAMEIPRESVKSQELHLVFDNGVTSRREILVMKDFDRDTSRKGKIKKLFGKEKRRDTWNVFRNEGLGGLKDYIVEESSSPEEYYEYYAKRMAPSPKTLRRQSMEAFSPAPLFSIVVPLYKTPLPYLKELIESVLDQSYGNWQLCLADGSEDRRIERYIEQNYGRDRRINYRHLEENTGISGNTNAALEMAEGDFIVFADHDDTLTPDALYENAKMISHCPDAEFLYSDEDLMDENGKPYDPHFKPDFNPDYLRSINYICHLVVVKRSLFEKVGPLNAEYDGAQDYDFVLRCAEQAKEVYHIRKVLYHWRNHAGSTAGNEGNKQYAIDAGRKALEAHYRRCGLTAEVRYTGMTIVYDTKFAVLGNPKVSVLIPNKDHTEDLDLCLRSIEEKTTWKNYEIVIIENNSEDPATFAYYEEAKKRWNNVRVVRYGGSFNYSAINNLGARFADGDYYLLLNNDTEVITPDWMERMLGQCQRKDVGIVGAKLFYPDDTIQHAGVVIGIGGIAGHIEVGREKAHSGYMRRLVSIQDISAVTAACLMIKKEAFEDVAGLDPRLAVAFNDVDLCLRVRELGLLVVFDPWVQLYHYESKSRGYETTPEKIRRFQREIRMVQDRHERILESGDPYYNPNLTLEKGDCSVAKIRETKKEGTHS